MELTFDALSVDLSGARVLDAITTTLRAGRVTAILGPNGAGKSTLLKAAAALVPIAAGTATLAGDPIAAMPPRMRARAIGYLPQDAAVHWNVPARDIVALGRMPHRSPFAAPDLADRPIAQLSGGERARVLLARVLAGEPRWLLADEPLASLDPAHQLDILARLHQVARQGSGVAIVLHDLGHAARIADDVLLLKDGRLHAAGPAAAVLTPDAIAAVFGVRARWIDTDDGPILVPVGRV